MTGSPGAGPRIAGDPTPEEVAAVLAVLSRRSESLPPDPFARWRRGRQEALRRTH